MTRVKICGLRRVEDAIAGVEAGADLLGLVFAASRRRIDPASAVEIVREARERGEVRAVGVFVNEEPAQINRIARLCALDYVQLSGDEPDEIVEWLDVPAIQVFHVRPDTSPDELADRLRATPAELVLLDTAREGSYGGTGATFDWSRLPPLERPVLLAGGLRPDNVADAIRIVRPWGVDVSSGVERSGEKDREQILAFVARVRETNAHR